MVEVVEVLAEQLNVELQVILLLKTLLKVIQEVMHQDQFLLQVLVEEVELRQLEVMELQTLVEKMVEMEVQVHLMQF